MRKREEREGEWRESAGERERERATRRYSTSTLKREEKAGVWRKNVLLRFEI